jgi:hypothetical protein
MICCAVLGHFQVTRQYNKITSAIGLVHAVISLLSCKHHFMKMMVMPTSVNEDYERFIIIWERGWREFLYYIMTGRNCPTWCWPNYCRIIRLACIYCTTVTVARNDKTFHLRSHKLSCGVLPRPQNEKRPATPAFENRTEHVNRPTHKR